MCGIIGIFSKNYINSLYAEKMLSLLRHRGPDNLGIVYFQTEKRRYYLINKSIEKVSQLEKIDFILGHARLSIIDLTDLANQPMTDEENKLWIVYNGEIFNYKELRKNLEKLGYYFKSNSDTEVLLYAYKEYRESCLEKLRGFFAFCIYDLENNKIFMARDRIGKKPLKYYWDENHFCFASEIKSLLQLPWIKKQINMEAIKQYFSLRYILSPFTIIDGIRKLPAGCFITFSLDMPQKEPIITRYYFPTFQPKTKISYKKYKDQTFNLLRDSIECRLISDVPLGLFLSGGIDSTTLLAILSLSIPDYNINTMTVGFSDYNYDERHYARVVANFFNTNHTEINVELNPEKDLKKIIWHFDEPFGDPSAIPTFYLTKIASQYWKVAITGDGGDELFGGYKRYYIHYRNRFLNYLPFRLFYKKANIFSKKIPFSWDKKHGWGKILRFLESISGNLINTYPLRFSGFSSRMQEILYNAKLSYNESIWTKDILELLKKTNASSSMEILMALDQITYLPEDILVKSDLGGMAHGLEIRCPFLDHLFVEWINLSPLSYKLNKKILRDILKDKIPIEILKRKKAGFNPPIGKWIKTILKQDLDFYLLSNESPFKILKKEEIKKMINLHFSEKINLGEPLWLLLVLAIWLKNYNIEF